jgi:hypothetical protein
MKKNDNIKTGTISEKELVELFGTPAQKKSYEEHDRFVSSYKSAVLKRATSQCEIKEVHKKKDGTQMYRITDVYSYPLPDTLPKMQKSLYKYIVPLILNTLVSDHDENNSIEITIGKWAREINMVNKNYNVVKYNREDISDEFGIQLDTINEFYDKADQMITYYINNALEYLRDAGLIIWRPVYRIVSEESSGTTTIDYEGNIETDIELTQHTASKEEMEFYAKCLRIADNEAEIESAGERYYSRKAFMFQDVLKRELYKRKIKTVYCTYEAYYVHLDRCENVLKQFGDFNARKFLDQFNEEFSDKLIENAGKRFDANTLKYLYENRAEYELTFDSMCNTVINNRAKRINKSIEEKDINEDYTFQIIQTKKGRKKNES